LQHVSLSLTHCALQEDWKVGINERVVSSLSLPLYENSATLLPLWFKASGGNERAPLWFKASGGNERARILVLLIVLQLIGQARKGEKISEFFF
jgi:hypothetical protein